MTRVFRVRNDVRIGAFTVDVSSWSSKDFSYDAKSYAKNTLVGTQGTLLHDTERSVVPIRLPLSGEGSIARLNQLKMREMSRR